MSAIVEFSSISEAKEALKSNAPVLNDRFIEVVSCSSKVAESPDTPSAPQPANEEVNKKLELIRQQRLAQQLELQTKRTGISRHLDLLRQYAGLWSRSREEARVPHEQRLRAVADKILRDVREVYHLVRAGVEASPAGEGKEMAGKESSEKNMSGSEVEGKEMEGKPMEGKPMEGKEMEGKPMAGKPMEGNPMEGNPMEGNAERAKREALATLDSVREAVRQTAVFDEIDAAATTVETGILDEAAREMEITRAAISGFRGRGRGRGRGNFRGRGRVSYRPRVDTSRFEMDLRPNVVILKDVEGVSEAEVREGLKEYPGVRGVTRENGEISIIFEKHWQTKRPTTMGIKVQGKVGVEGGSEG